MSMYLAAVVSKQLWLECVCLNISCQYCNAFEELLFISDMLLPIRLSSVCRVSVRNAHARYSADWNFPQFFYTVWHLGHPDIHGKFYGDRPTGTPPSSPQSQSLSC